MTTTAAPLTIGQNTAGFRLDRVTPLPNLRATAYLFEHLKSGARLLHVHSPTDTENCFAVTFPTPPADSTGLPHILEHAVLGGSRKFPVREPFFEMVKMSMATFINAMTHQAFTVYPIATNVKKDFFNLVDVYLDAVFFPTITDATFRREGHHLSLVDNKDLTSEVKVTGIVYNEMKGYYSKPDTLMWNLAGRGLFPDTPLGRDSGGDPERIPDLTFEQFSDFHRTRYHASNAQIFIYGDIPTADHLQFLAPVLDQFDRRPAPIAAPRQPRWTAPRQTESVYPIGKTEDVTARTYLTLNWAVGDGLDPSQTLAWSALAYILLGHEAAPLKKALIDSKLGADVFFAGAYEHAWESVFSIGLKGSEPDRADAFEKLVLDALTTIAGGGSSAITGITPAAVSSAFQQIAYSTLEVGTLFPMRVLSLVNDAWPFGADPHTFLRMDEHLAALRRRYESDPGMFDRMIRERLLTNAHRVRVVLRPDRLAQDRADDAFKAKMAALRATLDNAQIATIAREAAALEAAQGVPNSPEALAKLPQLKTSDLPAKPRHIPTIIGTCDGVTLLRNEVFANGVNYLELDVNLAGLPLDLYAALPRYVEAFDKMGAVGQDYGDISRRRASCTGGLGCWTSINRHATDSSVMLRRLRLNLKTLDGQADEALRLLGDLIFGVDPRDRARLRDVLTQTRAGMRTGLVNDGLGTARRHAARGLSPESAIENEFWSPAALRRMEAVCNNFDSASDPIIEQVERIRGFTHNRRRWTLSFTGSDAVFVTLQRHLREWSARMRDETIVDVLPAFQPFTTPPREGLAGPLKIAHCTMVMPGPHLSEPDVPLMGLGIYLSRFDYSLPEIRFKGNAYGAGVSYDDGERLVSQHSYSDPRIVETLSVFDGLRAFVDGTKWSQTDIDRAIIGAAKSAERPIRPGEATGAALGRHIRGDSNDLRERRYQVALGATPVSVKTAMLRHLDAGLKRAAICVVSSREKLEEANKSLGDRALSISDILP